MLDRFPYILARLTESSTWRGIILVLAAVGVQLEPARAEEIIAGGMALAGLIAVLFPDRAQPADQGPNPGA
jgi:hypothetical protein